MATVTPVCRVVGPASPHRHLDGTKKSWNTPYCCLSSFQPVKNIAARVSRMPTPARALRQDSAAEAAITHQGEQQEVVQGPVHSTSTAVNIALGEKCSQDTSTTPRAVSSLQSQKPRAATEEKTDPEKSSAANVSRRSMAAVLPLLAFVSASARAAERANAETLLLETEPAAGVSTPPKLLPAPETTSEVEAQTQREMPAAPATTSQVSLRILEGGSLGVSFYPDFGYNPKAGGGTGTATDLGDGRLRLKFNPESLSIPPLSLESTTFVGLPLPPPLKIEIVPSKLNGIIDRKTGQVNLLFKAQFFFTAGPIYAAPPLAVEAILTTESSIGSLREGFGKRLDEEGKGVLVAVAEVPPVSDGFLNRFLSLPTEVLAVLPAQLEFKT